MKLSFALAWRHGWERALFWPARPAKPLHTVR